MLDITKYQAHHNGPLKEEVAKYLADIKQKHNWAYKYIGEQLGISGGFAHNIIKKSGNITSAKPMPRIAEGIAHLEAGNTGLPSLDFLNAESANLLMHTFHLREGMQVSIELPIDLTKREAERLSLFVQSLAQ